MTPCNALAYMRIANAVAEHYGLPMSELRGQSRTAPIALARQVAMYLMRERVPAATYASIGTYFHRYPQTVRHDVEFVREQIALDERMRVDTEALAARLRHRTMRAPVVRDEQPILDLFSKVAL